MVGEKERGERGDVRVIGKERVGEQRQSEAHLNTHKPHTTPPHYTPQQLCYALGVQPLAALHGCEAHAPAGGADDADADGGASGLGNYARVAGGALVFLNGGVLGAHPHPQRLVRALRDLRRAGRLGEFVHAHLQNDAAHVSCDGGRVCRPLIICDAGVPRVTDAHIARLKAGEWGFQDFLARGE